MNDELKEKENEEENQSVEGEKREKE